MQGERSLSGAAGEHKILAAGGLQPAEMKERRMSEMEPSEPCARLVKGTVHPACFGMCLAAGCQALKQKAWL